MLICMNYIGIVFFNFLAGGGMADANCGSILSNIRFCTRSLIGANTNPSRLNLAWIDSALFTQEAKANIVTI